MTSRKKRPGTAPAPLPGESGFSLISRQKLIALYTVMLKCRLLERRLHSEELGRLPQMRGREAVAAGVALDLRAGDKVCAVDGGVLPKFVQTRSVHAVLAQLHLGSEPVESGALEDAALETARALAKRKTKRAVVLFCGATAVRSRVLRRAAAERLPILFLCHNQKKSKNLAAAADACGLPGITVDCEDAVAIYRVASEALGHARRGNGPTLIECRRWKVARGRQAGRGSDALRAMKRYLSGKGLWTNKLKEKTAAAFAHELEKAFAAIKAEPR
jgi:acetoin:2,6-dichlorophenolindophenol oxidoreductase subunit alpha